MLLRGLSPDDFEEDRCRALVEVMEALAGEEGRPSPSTRCLSGWERRATGAEELIRDVMSGEYRVKRGPNGEDGVLKMRAKTFGPAQEGKARLEKAATEEEKTRLLQEHKFLGEEITRLKGND